MKLILPLAAASLLLSTACCSLAPESDCEDCAGCGACSGGAWVSLWDGVSDPTEAGWAMAGPGEFVVRDGSLVATGGMGLLWYTEQSFRDFTLSLEWSVEDAGDNSGVFVRFPDPGDDPWVAVHEGYELQLCDAADAMHNTGSVYSFQGSSHVPTLPAGEWNTYEISVVDQHYTVKVNGEVVNEFDGERSREGFVGLQNHDDGSPVRFRNLRVQAHGG